MHSVTWHVTAYTEDIKRCWYTVASTSDRLKQVAFRYMKAWQRDTVSHSS